MRVNNLNPHQAPASAEAVSAQMRELSNRHCDAVHVCTEREEVANATLMEGGVLIVDICNTLARPDRVGNQVTEA